MAALHKPFSYLHHLHHIPKYQIISGFSQWAPNAFILALIFIYIVEYASYLVPNN